MFIFQQNYVALQSFKVDEAAVSHIFTVELLLNSVYLVMSLLIIVPGTGSLRLKHDEGDGDRHLHRFSHVRYTSTPGGCAQIKGSPFFWRTRVLPYFTISYLRPKIMNTGPFFASR
jgi:hypothetical protein